MQHQTTTSAGDTILLGEKIGRSLKPDDVVALNGELGAGKTTLIQGIAKGLGISDWVTSPTFTIINEFKGNLNLYHIDLYRLNSVAEAEDLAIEEYWTKGGVTAIEWAEKIKDILPDNLIEIDIRVKNENEREIDIKGLKA
jgi:tRNA threonylcarbamoyladenosine biosynthesis protein TsaE